MNGEILDRRSLLKSVLVGASASLLGKQELGWAAAKPENKKPNIVIIVTDDHGFQLGCYGNKSIKTPNMDALAAEGTKFTNAFCTSATCSASRSVILTGLQHHANGQYGHSHGIHGFKTFDGIKSLPVYLKESGYRTALVGKLHVQPDSVYKFDETIKADGRNPVEMANRSQDFITAGDEPFLLYYSTYDPHVVSGTAKNLPYNPNLFGNKPDGGYEGVKQVKYKPKDVEVPDFLNDTPKTRANLAQYYQAISRVDQGMGRLFEILRKAGKYENTLIIYISDNGPDFQAAKVNMYEAGINLPCIIKSPRQRRKGITCNAMISWTDITPTICDLAGALPDDSNLRGIYKKLGMHFQGRSFKSVLEQENPQGWNEIYASQTFHAVWFYYPMRVVRDRKYKLIWNLSYQTPFPWFRGSRLMEDAVERDGKYYFSKYHTVDDFSNRPKFEFYDIKNDPGEIKNLADKPEYSKLLKEYKNKIKEFQKKTQDPWIEYWSWG